ncbi:hypothetical protein [Acinetobacter sp. YH01020]|uniref:hypothetical protein n=1 Tax=Acinetobacter sp. YH01020 TaxID=2601034 RepID=UPI0015D2807B|nr:hypothetical protein [Acinetobacter sp. YH01020]
MKKLLVLATVTSISISAFATTQFASSELKAMDCATLAVEKANAKRSLEAAEKNIANIQASAQAPGKSLSKFAGLAGGALAAFGGNSEKAARAGNIANSLAGEQDTSDASNLELQQANKSAAQANIDNIGIYQGSKKCKI